MKFKDPVREGLFIKRYKRFFADIDTDGQSLTAHVPNTGSLKSCLTPQAPCRYTVSDDPHRKLKYTLQMIKPGRSWVGVNTALSNALVWEAWEKGLIPDWKKFNCAQREVKISDASRIDMVLWDSTCAGGAPDGKIGFTDLAKHRFHLVEIKNVTLCENDIAYFPDAVTVRGQKHLQELMTLIDQGHTCEMVFTVQRRDASRFAPADHIDPEYGRLFRQAIKKGVKITPFLCRLSADSITLDPTAILPVEVEL